MGDLKEGRLTFGSLMEIGVTNGMIKSLHDTMRNQLKTLFDEIRKLSSKLQDNDATAAEVNSNHLEHSIILIDHLHLNRTVDSDQVKFPDLMLDQLFGSLLCLMDNRQRLYDDNLSKSIVNL